jgi:hypothetical protein
LARYKPYDYHQGKFIPGTFEHILSYLFMALSCDTRPHFTTIADFISTLDKEIVRLFLTVLLLRIRRSLICDEMNLIGKEDVPNAA